VDGLDEDTITETIAFKKECDDFASDGDCDVKINGGSERGHSTRGQHTHGKGDKVDIDDTPEFNAYVENHNNFTPVSEDEDPRCFTNQCYIRDDDVFNRHNGHWDVCVNC